MRLLLAAMSLVLVAACGSSDNRADGTVTASAPAGTSAPAAADPAAAVEELMRALDAGNCDEAKAVVVTPSALDCGEVEAAAGSFADEGTDLDAATYSAGPIEDTSSTVTIDWGNENPEESYDVEKIDGKWLVVFDSAA